MSAEARRLKDEINECIQGADLEWSRIVPVRRSGSSLGSTRRTAQAPASPPRDCPPGASPRSCGGTEAPASLHLPRVASRHRAWKADRMPA